MTGAGAPRGSTPPQHTPRPGRGPLFAAATDHDLARRAALGSRPDFEEIVRRHGPALLRFTRRMLSDAGDAEDAVQDTFVAAWQGLPDWRGERTQLRAWLFSITAHKTADILRKKRPAPLADLPESTASPLTGPEETAVYRDLRSALGAALQALPARQRSVWLLREVEALSYKEIGEALSMPYDVVRGHLARARTTLARRLQPWR